MQYLMVIFSFSFQGVVLILLLVTTCLRHREFFLYFSPYNGLFNKMLIMLLVFLHIGTYKCFRVLITDK